RISASAPPPTTRTIAATSTAPTHWAGCSRSPAVSAPSTTTDTGCSSSTASVVATGTSGLDRGGSGQDRACPQTGRAIIPAGAATGEDTEGRSPSRLRRRLIGADHSPGQQHADDHDRHAADEQPPGTAAAEDPHEGGEHDDLDADEHGGDSEPGVEHTLGPE